MYLQKYKNINMKFVKIVTCTLGLSLALSSCKKLLEIKDTDSIAGEIALKTVTNNEQSIVGAYAILRPEMAILLNSTFADEVKKGEFYNAETTHEWQYGSTDIGIRDNFTAITPNYQIIDRVNRVLQALPNVTAANAAEEAKKSVLKGEALFLRAYAHFELFRYYCGNYTAEGLAMPYMEVPSLLTYERIKLAPYFAKINADLEEAKGLITNNLNDKNRANRLSVVALQARVALYTKNWASAIALSTEYITALPLATKEQFPGIWSDANTSEVAFKLARTVSVGGRVGGLFRGQASVVGGVTKLGTITWAPSDKLWGSYDQDNDIRFSTYLMDEPLLKAETPVRQSHIIKKYTGTAYTTNNENLGDIKVFRTGEMVLIRAEAKAESNDLAGATADINMLRSARISNYTNVADFASKDAAITAILEERLKELPFEGHRFWDLKRKEKAVERVGNDIPSSKGATLPANNFRFVLPIPNSEILANPKIREQQNPGYEG
jgi:hypothetical protein